MQQVFVLFKEAYSASRKDTGKMTKTQLVKRLSVFFNRCLILMRAYNFDSQLVLMIGEYA